MRTLILMRHAKSSWDDPLQDDHDRPLNARGTRSAAAMGDWLRAKGYNPDAALSSTAARTAETFDGLRLNIPMRYLRPLYHANAPTILEILRGGTGTSLLMIGHNPGISAFAEQIVRDPPDHPRFWDYPTCATLVATFDIDDWAKADWRAARTVDFATPHDLS